MAPLSHLDPKRSQVSSRFGSLVHSRLMNKRVLWVWPLLALPLMALIGYAIFARVEQAIRDNVAGQLTAVLNADVEALRIWMSLQQDSAESAANDQQTAALANRLLALASTSGESVEKWMSAPEQQELANELAPRIAAGDYKGFVLLNNDLLVVASSYRELLGQTYPVKDEKYLEKHLAGKPFVTRPFPSTVLLTDSDGQKRAGVPTMLAVSSIRNEQKKVVGALALRIEPQTDFTRILSVGQFGKSGETYAFNSKGALLSRSRFEDDLKNLNLMPDDGHSTSIFNVEARNPMVDLTTGARSVAKRSELPLTVPIASAIEGNSGVDVQGYRDYRGVMSLGAWQWLPEYGMGVVTEVSIKEAFAAAYIVRTVNWIMFGLMALLSVGIFGFTILLARMQQRAREASVAAKKVGQYQLEDKIGQGGMGVVYRGKHAMLRRPTAVKLLDPQKTTEESIGRFEREVRLTSLLNHPNTITVYDYGRTDEGVFYYAMELLEGIDLEELVRLYGMLPPGRVVHLLRQICGSLAEAHDAGLIHRDIKPGNIMLTRRGGIADFIKVLDFGLVKALSSGPQQASLTMANTLTGTPLYMSPEAIERTDTVDARSDIYAVGAVGYYLLTGTPVFTGNSVVEICMAQVSKTPERPSIRCNRHLPVELEDALLACLAKNPESRPQTAKDLSAMLAKVPLEKPWTDDDATAWWAGYARPDLLETRDVSTNRIPLETQAVNQAKPS